MCAGQGMFEEALINVIEMFPIVCVCVALWALTRESNDPLELTKFHSEVIAGVFYIILTDMLVM